MARFVTIGYGDQEGYERTDQAARDAAHAHDRHLQESGAMPVVGVAGPAVQVRNHGASGVESTDGAFATSALPVAGFALIEAEDLDEAVRLASPTPGHAVDVSAFSTPQLASNLSASAVAVSAAAV